MKVWSIYLILTCLYSLIILIFLVYATHVKKQIVPPMFESISDIVARDLHCLGEYSSKTTISIKYWVYAIEVAIWNDCKKMSSLEFFLSWNKDYNYDPDSFIYEGIQKAHTMFLLDIDNARKEEREPEFKVDKDYDFHVCANSLKYNDHVNVEALLKSVDIILGGDV